MGDGYKDMEPRGKKTFDQVTMSQDFDQYLFGEGTHYEIYQRMGSHLTEKDGKEGVCFSVWAPNAAGVSVVGEFNEWEEGANPMNSLGISGIYEVFVPGAIEGNLYKYCITTKDGRKLYKADPYANLGELRPGNASRITKPSDYDWRDALWCRERSRRRIQEQPVAVYEVHPGSWMKHMNRKEGSDGFYNYKQLAHSLGDYVKEMGYTHVELMGISEYPYDGSWGYQVTGYFAPTARYGNPDDFRYFVDYLHRQGIGVILDWVPAHFPKDDHGLAEFDGTCVYEYEDPRKGEHPDWGTKVFDYSKNQVKNFLIASAVYWLKEYHVDGLRVDAVSSMLYLDYGRGPGQWIPNEYGGNQNLEAVSFLRTLNQVIKERVPGAFVIAEESTAWPQITGSVEEGGLGFDFKWNMGWMNDTLAYYGKDPIYRKYHHNNMTFGMTYAYAENYVLPYSHDEVVHGKGTLLEKMPGTLEEKFGDLRSAYGFFFGHPGKKLLFMGQEFAQRREWSEERELDWFLLDEPLHRGMQEYVKELLHLYRNHPCMYEQDCTEEGFTWIEPDDKERGVLVFARHSRDRRDHLLFVCNFTPVDREEYSVGVLEDVPHHLVLDSDQTRFGGQGIQKKMFYLPEAVPAGKCKKSFAYHLPGFGMAVFSYKSK